MKVKIGPYRNWIGPYQISEFLLTPLTWFKPKRPGKLEQALTETQDPHDALCHKLGDWLARRKDGSDTYLTKVCQWIDRKKKRTIKIKIDPWDTWNMNDTLALIILPMLKQLKANKHGSPFVNQEDVPEHLWAAEEPSDENGWLDNTHHERWEWVMDEMIWAFEQLSDEDNDAQFHSGNFEMLWQAQDKDGNPIGIPEPMESRTKHEGAVTYQMVKGPNDTSVFDRKGYETHHKRIANGLRLFGTYYQGLWD
jgi:hypothetical protein